MLGADDPPRRLQHLVHAGKAVGAVEAAAVLFVKVAAQHLLPGADLGQAHPHDGAADQPAAHQIDPLPKDAAQHPEAQQGLGGVGDKAGQKGRPPGLVQAALLGDGADAGIAGGKVGPDLPQVGVAGEEGKVIAHLALGQSGQCVRDGADAGLPMTVAGGDARQAVKAQIPGRERAFQRDGPGSAAAEHLFIVGGRDQGSAEQHRSPPARQTLVHKGGGVQAEQADGQLAAAGGQLGDGVLIVAVGGAQQVVEGKVQLQQLLVRGVVGVVFQPVLQGRQQAVQGPHHGRRQLPEKDGAVLSVKRLGQGRGGGGLFCGGRLVKKAQLLCLGRFRRRYTLGAGLRAPAGRQRFHCPAQDKQFPVRPEQVAFQGVFAPQQSPLGLGDAALGKAGRVHLPGPVGQVVRLVDEEDPVPGQLEKAPQVDGGVKEIVVVPDHQVGPVAQVQPQLKGADGELPGRRFDGRAVQLAAAVQQGGQRLLPAVVIASGIGTGLRHTNRPARLVFGQADFFFGGQRHRAEHQPRVRLPQQDNSVLGGRASCRSGCKVE